MPLTKTEQSVFNRAIDGPYLDEPDDRKFLRRFQDILFELTDNVILKMRLDNIVEKL